MIVVLFAAKSVFVCGMSQSLACVRATGFICASVFCGLLA